MNKFKKIYLNKESIFFKTKDLSESEKEHVLEIIECAKDYQLKNRSHDGDKNEFNIADFLKKNYPKIKKSHLNWVKKIYKDINVVKFNEKHKAFEEKANKLAFGLKGTTLSNSNLLDLLKAYFINKMSLNKINADFAKNQNDYEAIKNSLLQIPKRLPKNFIREVLKAIFYNAKNDIYLELSYIYDRFADGRKNLIYIEPSIYIIDKLISDNYLADRNVIVAISNKVLLDILKTTDLPDNIILISTDSLDSITVDDYNVCVFIKDIEKIDMYLKCLRTIGNVLENCELYLYGTDNILNKYSSIHDWLVFNVSIEECVIIPPGIKDASSPQEKILFKCSLEKSDSEIITKKLSLNPKNKMSLVFNSYVCSYKQDVFANNSIRSIYGKDYLNYQRKTDKERKHLDEIVFSREIVIKPSISYSNNKFRCKCFVKMPKDIDKRQAIEGINIEAKSIKQTERFEDCDSFEEAQYFINSKYLFKKKKDSNNLCTYEDIKTIFEKIYEYRIISLATFCLMYFDEISKKVSKEYLTNLFGLDENGYLDRNAKSLINSIGDYDLVELNNEILQSAFTQFNLSEEKESRYIIYTSNIINLAIEKGHAENNPISKQTLRKARSLLGEVKLSFMKRHNSEIETNKILSSIKEDPERLLFEIRSYAGVEYEHLCNLRKKDFIVDKKTQIMSMVINYEYNNSPINLIPLNDYLKNRISEITKNTNDEDKVFAFKNKKLDSTKKVDAYMRNKVKIALELKQKIDTFNLKDKKVEVDYNDYNRDYFANSFKFMAHKYGFYDSEIRFLMFKYQKEVYAQHYKDFNNALVQYSLKKKMERIYNKIIYDETYYGISRNTKFAKDFELLTSNNVNRLSHCEIEIVVPAHEKISLEISNEYGFETSVERIS